MTSCEAYPWSFYADLQQRSDKLTRLSDYWWGMERAMAYLIEAIASGTVPVDPNELEATLDRKIASGARLHRDRVAALVNNTPISEPVTAGDVAAETRIQLKTIIRIVSSNDRNILLDAGMGYTDREIADRRGATPGAVRVRLSRLRHKLAA